MSRTDAIRRQDFSKAMDYLHLKSGGMHHSTPMHPQLQAVCLKRYQATRTVKIYIKGATFRRIVNSFQLDAPINRTGIVTANGKTVQCTRNMSDFETINLLIATAFMLLKEQSISNELKQAYAHAIAARFNDWSSETQTSPLQ